MRMHPMLILVTVAGLSAGESDLTALASLRDRLLVSLPATPGEELTLVLAGAADDDDLVIRLSRRGTALVGAEATVPAWAAESLSDHFRSIYQNQAFATYDRLRFPVDAAALRWNGAGAQGTVTAALRLDGTRSERMPPGMRVFLVNTGERWSWYDLFRATEHRTERPLRCHLDVHPLPGVSACELRFAGIADGAAVTWRFLHPARPFDRAAGGGWNGGYHQADTSGLVRDAASLRGTATLRIMPDIWMPKDQLVRTLEVNVDATVSPDGRVTGTWMRVDDASVGGALGGWIRQAVEGTYRSGGGLPAAAGRVSGWQQAFPPATSLLGASDPVANPVAAATGIWLQLRALDALACNPGRNPALLLDELAAPVPTWADPASAQAAAYIARMRRAAEDLLAAPATMPSPVPGALPLASTALAGGHLPETAGWYHLAEWRILGPVPATPGMLGAASRIPDLLPALDATYPSLGSAKPAKGRGEAALAWTVQPANGPLLQPAWERIGNFSSFRAQAWYAAATISAPAARDIQLAIGASDAGATSLWWNDQLVWTSPEPSFARTVGGTVHLTVTARAGTNELIVRQRAGRDASGFRLAIGVAAPASLPTSPRGALAGSTLRGDGSGQMGDALPPLAWDIPSGRQVAWTAAIPAGGSMPVAGNDLVAVMGGANALSVFVAASGAPRFTAEVGAAPPAGTIARSAPAVTAERIYAHGALGAVAAFDHTGKRLWTIETGLRSAVLYPLPGLLVVVGGTAAEKKGAESLHQAIALADGDGTARWTRKLSGGFSARSCAVLGLEAGGRLRRILFASGGEFVDLDDGRVVGASPDGQTTGVAVQAAADGVVYTVEQRRRAAWRLGLDAQGGLLATRLWQTRHEISGFMDVPFCAVGAGDAVALAGKPPEHGPHCPLPVAEMEIVGVADGALRGRIKPVLRQAMNHTEHPVYAGRHVFITDTGGGFAVSERAVQTAVVALDPVPHVVAVNRMPLAADSDVTPCIAAGRIYIRQRESLVAIAASDPTWQATRLAETLVSSLDPPEQAPRPRPMLASDATIDPARSPLSRIAAAPAWMVPIASIDMPEAWLVAPAGAQPPERVPERIPAIGEAAPDGAPWQALPAAKLLVRTPYGTENTYLQGRGQRIILRPKFIDPSAWGEGAGWLATVLENPRERVLSIPEAGREVRYWLDGTPLASDERVRLAPGRHVLLVRIGAGFRTRVATQIPVDVAAAIAGGALSAIAVPGWTVFGPLPSGSPAPERALLAIIPDALPGAGAGRRMPTDQGLLQLAQLNVLPDGSTSFSGERAIAYATVEVPADGRLVGNAGVDWQMAWYVDGEERYTCFGRGGGGTAKITGHTWSAPVSKGTHVIAVLTECGSKGWAMRSLIGFSADPPGALERGFPATGVTLPDPTPPLFSLRFLEHEDPIAADAARRQRIAALAVPLRAVVADLPGTPAAQRAAALLGTLP